MMMRELSTFEIGGVSGGFLDFRPKPKPTPDRPGPRPPRETPELPDVPFPDGERQQGPDQDDRERDDRERERTENYNCTVYFGEGTAQLSGPRCPTGQPLSDLINGARPR